MKSSGFGITGTKAVISSPIKTEIKKPEIKTATNKRPSLMKQKPAPVIKKEAIKPIKVEKIAKNQQSIHQNMIKQEVKVSEPVMFQQIKIQQPIVSPPIIQLVQINYSHYTTKFQSINKTLSFQTIDDKYCISFVFKGNFIPKLLSSKSKQYAEYTNGVFRLNKDDPIYILQIQQDQQQQSKYQNKGYTAPKQAAICKPKKRLQQLTNDLKQLSIEQLKNKGDKYRQLIEQRDLEDILYN